MKLAQAGGTPNPGLAFGSTVAQRILDDRRNDPNAGDSGYVPSLARGRHRVDPDNPGQGFHAPFYGARSKGFAITKRHKLDKPPFGDGDNNEYVRALRQVRAKGITPELIETLPENLEDDERNPEETLIGIFWASTMIFRGTATRSGCHWARRIQTRGPTIKRRRPRTSRQAFRHTRRDTLHSVPPPCILRGSSTA